VVHSCRFTLGAYFPSSKMSSTVSKPRLIRFGLFELDYRAGELRKTGTRIKLQDQPLQVLELLLQRPGELVTRDELRASIWPADTFVDFDKGLYTAVNRLRDALQDLAENPRFIQTVPKRGYRFIAPVSVVMEAGETQPAPTGAKPSGSEPSREPPHPTPHWLIWGTRAVVSAVVLAGLVTAVRWQQIQSWVGGKKIHVRSLAVLPLENLAADPRQDPFADEMTEELITQFSKSADWRVISRTSVMQYKGTRKPLPQIAGELNVDAVVEGAVQRVEDRIRISVQLVDARMDRQLWAETYDREFRDILGLQSEVARDVAARCAIQLPVQPGRQADFRLAQPESESYEAYLMGRYYWNKRTGSSMKMAAEYFQKAIQQNPRNGLAYAGLADFYAFLSLIGGPETAPPRDAMAKARAAAIKATELDDTLAETHASMGHILHNYDWDWPGAEREFKRAIELNPNYATAHHWYSHYLMQMGRSEESLAEATRAHELDPLSPFINNGLGRQYFLTRQYDKAIAQGQKALQIDPAYVPAMVLIGMAYEQKSMFPEAIAQFERAGKLSATYAVSKDTPAPAQPPALPVVVAMLGHALALSGHQEAARSKLQELLAISKVRYVASSYVAIIYIGLGDKDRAFEWLERDYQNRSEHLLYLTVEPMVDPLRSDPRFHALVKKIGLP